MDRNSFKEFTHKATQFLNIENIQYKQWVFRYTFLELEKDLGTKGDITTKIVFPEKKISLAKIIAKADGVLAGRQEIEYFLRDSDPTFKPHIRGDIDIKFLVEDGEDFKKGDVILEIGGEIHDLLAVERVTLNLLMRMSGIATLTKKITEKVKYYPVLITPTRKTLWGLLDKRAVMLGGGGTHRINLTDAILVKDTHADILNRDFKEIIKRVAKSSNTARFCEIEVETKEEALEVSQEFTRMINNGSIINPGIVLLDNMSPEKIKETLELIKSTEAYDKLLFEASGGITIDTIENYADTGIDIISMGSITNDAKVVDMSMKVGE